MTGREYWTNYRAEVTARSRGAGAIGIGVRIVVDVDAAIRKLVELRVHVAILLFGQSPRIDAKLSKSWSVI